MGDRSAGSRPARRDPIDARIVRSVIDGDGRFLDRQQQVGGYSVRRGGARRLELPAHPEQCRRFLQKLSSGLESDRELDLSPLWRRLGVKGASR